MMSLAIRDQAATIAAFASIEFFANRLEAELSVLGRAHLSFFALFCFCFVLFLFLFCSFLT